MNIVAALGYFMLVWYAVEYQSVESAILVLGGGVAFGLLGFETRLNQISARIDALTRQLFPGRYNDD